MCIFSVFDYKVACDIAKTYHRTFPMATIPLACVCVCMFLLFASKQELILYVSLWYKLSPSVCCVCFPFSSCFSCFILSRLFRGACLVVYYKIILFSCLSVCVCVCSVWVCVWVCGCVYPPCSSYSAILRPSMEISTARRLSLERFESRNLFMCFS